ncbi:sensor domain-containing diguanylate cyclase [Nostoc sp. 3335mG]|nr:sensor domain-containing diguanylate cyclase [Nostoc sp. 3335mG]
MEQSPSSARFPGGPYATWFVAAASYFLLATSTLLLTSDGKTIATVWPANAVLIALLLLQPSPRWITVLSAGLIGNVLANWLVRGSLAGPLLYSFANLVEVAVTVLLLRRGAKAFDLFGSVRALMQFVIVAGATAPAISGAFGASTAALFYEQPFATAFLTWFASDGLGLLVFTPTFTAIFSGKLADCIKSKSASQRIKTIGLLSLVAAMAYAVFFLAEVPALFLLYAPVMLVTFRVGPIGTKLAVLEIAVIGALATASGNGPIVTLTADTTLQAQMFQAFLATMLLTCLPVAAEIAERKRLTEQLAEKAIEADIEAATDTLTGLLNRRGLDRQMPTVLSASPNMLCCVAIDVDRFKAINDRWGHSFGDEVLKHLAMVLRSNTRPGDLIVRQGGDEFLMILRVGDEYTGEVVCARIQAALRQQVIAADAKTSIMVSISCGIAAFMAGERMEDVINRADRALYDVKKRGRNGFRSAS